MVEIKVLLLFALLVFSKLKFVCMKISSLNLSVKDWKVLTILLHHKFSMYYILAELNFRLEVD